MNRLARVLSAGAVLVWVHVGHAGEVVEVSIKDFAFTPQEVSIPAGTTVRWVNREKRQYHSVWFEALGEPEPDYLFPDEFYERTFAAPGNFSYRCGPHPYMTGTVRVAD